jgi:hypothetical protein
MAVTKPPSSQRCALPVITCRASLGLQAAPGASAARKARLPARVAAGGSSRCRQRGGGSIACDEPGRLNTWAGALQEAQRGAPKAAKRRLPGRPPARAQGFDRRALQNKGELTPALTPPPHRALCRARHMPLPRQAQAQAPPQPRHYPGAGAGGQPH